MRAKAYFSVSLIFCVSLFLVGCPLAAAGLYPLVVGSQVASGVVAYNHGAQEAVQNSDAQKSVKASLQVVTLAATKTFDDLGILIKDGPTPTDNGGTIIRGATAKNDFIKVALYPQTDKATTITVWSRDKEKASLFGQSKVDYTFARLILDNIEQNIPLQAKLAAGK
ncbi:MAG: hypothetical protein G01um101466_308 [Parcubacteria group bacterium Gr01-1014_66]|nr:MAG: hypothetical protein G01um101466_308 [Parcubacteria group bacterium Gr01-1014_66]